MLRTELLEYLGNGEDSRTEFKRDTLQAHDLAEEMVALANSAGGRVFLGVDDDASIVGITRHNLEEWVMSAARDLVRPEIIPYYETVRDVEPGKDVAVVTVEPGYTVHHVWRHNRRRYVIRVGSQSREASSEELERLFQRRGSVRAELRPIPGAGLEEFDRSRLRDYFRRVRQQTVPRDTDADAWLALLINTELLTDESERTTGTLAGVLLFAERPNQFLPQAGIDAVAYPGTDKDYAARERASLRGPMTPLVRGGKLAENGLVEQALEFVRRNTGVTASLREGARRAERPEYPEPAIRESVVNALIHRDYLLSASDVELSVYPDRLEVVSPGRLLNGVTPTRMRAGVRAARNQLLKDIMRDYSYLEHMGLGIPRKIVRGMKEHNGTDPELIEEGETFVVRLRSQ